MGDTASRDPRGGTAPVSLWISSHEQSGDGIEDEWLRRGRPRWDMNSCTHRLYFFFGVVFCHASVTHSHTHSHIFYCVKTIRMLGTAHSVPPSKATWTERLRRGVGVDYLVHGDGAGLSVLTGSRHSAPADATANERPTGLGEVLFVRVSPLAPPCR